ncbi:Adenylate kinase 7 [Hondaea fermentalgiana]|uniref:Adenylate kinase 7 n=1 Tax=Hondaea fermentalgiana TaxID=2315210 RepID=A0A2R5GSY7_9STRA|nr:Adenylate kinase 7 [Hondaea fermentalgiana]|eukprot:GBG32878.1 Adenylate kinase 7 [Hondaea fermentalgiana]
MRVFIEGVDGFVGRAVQRILEADFAAKRAELQEAGGEADADAETLEIIGSVSYDLANENNLVPNGVVEAVSRKDLDAVCALARSADSIVLDTHESVLEASAVVKALKNPFEGSKSVVLVSTLLTWDNTPASVALSAEETKTEDEEGGEGAAAPTVFAESSFTQRRPSPNYLLHKTLESQVLALSHETLSTTVLASGLLYGAEQGPFHEFFRDAWLGRPLVLPDINSACSNVVPTVHVQDLARAACSALATPPAQQYVVVADGSHDSVADIVSAIFSVVQPHPELALLEDSVPPEDEDDEARAERESRWKAYPTTPSFAGPEDTDEILIGNPAWGMLQCSLRFDTAESTVQELVPEWHCREGQVESMLRMAREFRAARDLRPLRVVLSGPPASGKSMVASKLAQKYCLPLVSAEAAVQEMSSKLKEFRDVRAAKVQAYDDEKARRKAALAAEAKSAEGKEGEGDDDGETKAAEGDEEDDEVSPEDDPERQILFRKTALELLAEKFEKCLASKGKVSNKLVARAIRAKLLSSACQNQGYVLDDFDQTYFMLRSIFEMSATAMPVPEDGEEPAAEDGEVVDEDFEDAQDDPRAGAAGDGEGDEAAEAGVSASLEEIVIDPRIVPTGVLALDADDEALRAIAKASVDADEDAFETSLARFREHCAEDLTKTPLSFLEGNCRLETLLLRVDLPTAHDFAMSEEKCSDEESKVQTNESEEKKQSEDEAMTPAAGIPQVNMEAVEMYVERGGRPHNYRPTAEERAQAEAQAKADRLAREEEDRRERMDAEKERRREEEDRHKATDADRKHALDHEAALLRARAEPLHNYLMEFVMPTLSKGLIETCRTQPDDPVDFLAEYLFKHSGETESQFP